MINRDILLEMVRDGLESGAITKADLVEMAGQPSVVAEAQTPNNVVPIVPKPPSVEDHANKAINVVDTLFYLAGIILFSALGAAVAGLGSDSWVSSLVLLIPGLLFWFGAYMFGKKLEQTDTVKGLVNAMVLAGSLSIVSGGMVVANKLAGNSNTASSAYVYATALAIFGGLQLFFDRIFRHVIPVVLGMYMIIAAFPVALTGILSNTTVPVDGWSVIFMGTACLIAYGGIITSKTAPGREYLKGAFLPVAGFTFLGSVYVASLTSAAAVVWQLLLPLFIYVAFFYSVKRRSQNFLFTGSVFLALDLITLSFKYFSGLGVSFCLILSAVALLGTAFLSININKRYIKQT